MGPAEEEIGDNGDGRRRVRSEPLNYWISEIREGTDYGDVAGISEIFDVFDAGRNFRVRREGKNDGVNGIWVSGEKGV